MSVWSPDDRERRAHPQLAQLAVLDHQLDVVVDQLADLHAPDGRPAEQRDQARALIRVVRALRAQINAYRRVLDVPRPPPGRGDW